MGCMACPNSCYHARDFLLEQTDFVINLVMSEATHADGAAIVSILKSEYFLGAFEDNTKLSYLHQSVARRKRRGALLSE